MKRKRWVLDQPPYSPKETGGSHPGWNHLIKGIDHLTRRRTQGVGIVKGWDDMRDRGSIPDTLTSNKNDTSAGPLNPTTIEPRLPPPQCAGEPEIRPSPDTDNTLYS